LKHLIHNAVCSTWGHKAQAAVQSKCDPSAVKLWHLHSFKPSAVFVVPGLAQA